MVNGVNYQPMSTDTALHPAVRFTEPDEHEPDPSPSIEDLIAREQAAIRASDRFLDAILAAREESRAA